MPLSAPLLVAECMHAAERGVTRVNPGGLRGVCAGQPGGRPGVCSVQCRHRVYRMRCVPQQAKLSDGRGRFADDYGYSYY